MNDISNILLTKRNSAIDEVNRSSPNLNTNSDCKDIDISVRQALQVGGDDTSQSISKSQQIISTPFSVQESNGHDTNIENTLEINQSEPTFNDASLSASFKQLSRRESSLENLAEDDTNIQINASASDTSVTYFLQKEDPNNDIRDFTRKSESSSRFRRTMDSLFSCCSTKSRRSEFVTKLDVNNDSESEKCTGQIIIDRSDSKEQRRSLNCLRLRKFFDILDESETIVKRVPHVRQSFPSVPYRDGDKTDSSSRKAGDNLQSENGGSNLTYSDHEFAPIIPESESLLSVAPFYSTRSVLLGPIKPPDHGKKCFIIDLDETLVHSSFKMVDKADFKVGVDIEGTVHTVYVLKRPYVDLFLQKMGRIFECVLFTASLAKYADPVTDFLDKWRVFRWRLFRESCVFHRGNYVKDLGMLGRQMDQIAILDNSPASYMFHPDSAIQITSWFDDPKDTALLDLIPYLEQLADAPSVPSFLATVKPPPRATVPVSVMLPSPGNCAVLPLAQPIASISPPSPPPLPISSPPLSDKISPLYTLANLPFSPSHNNDDPHQSRLAHSSSLPSVGVTRHCHDPSTPYHSSSSSSATTIHSRSEGTLIAMAPVPFYTVARPTTDPPPLSHSTVAPIVRLVLFEKPLHSPPAVVSPPATGMAPRSASLSLRHAPRSHSPTRSQSFHGSPSRSRPHSPTTTK